MGRLMKVTPKHFRHGLLSIEETGKMQWISMLFILNFSYGTSGSV